MDATQLSRSSLLAFQWFVCQENQSIPDSSGAAALLPVLWGMPDEDISLRSRSVQKQSGLA